MSTALLHGRSPTRLWVSFVSECTLLPFVWSTRELYRGTQRMTYAAHCLFIYAGQSNLRCHVNVDHVFAIAEISVLAS